MDYLFDRGLFFNRYIAGGVSLETSRAVSRKELALSRCQRSEEYSAAELLRNQIEAFNSAAKLVQNAKEFSINFLAQLNALLTPKSRGGGTIRTVQNWIGTSKEKPLDIPPPPEMVFPLLSELVDYLNCTEAAPVKKAVNAYVKLLRIHPFPDGNGRVARALYDGFMRRAGKKYVHFSLYRLGIEQPLYWQFICGHEIGFCDYHEEDYYKKSCSWCKKLSNEVDLIVSDAVQSITNKFILYSRLTDSDEKLLNHLINQPVITDLCISLRPEISKDSIHKFLDAGVLKKSRYSLDKSLVIYSQVVFDFWEKIDLEITKNKETA